MAEQSQKVHDDLDTRVEKSHMEITSMRHAKKMGRLFRETTPY